MLLDEGEPFVGRWSVRPELLELAQFFTVEQSAVHAETARDRGVHQVARVGGTHLEEDSHFKLALSIAIECPIQIVERVDPCHNMDAMGWSILQEFAEYLVGLGGTVIIAGGK